jgi:hypothetical protein
MTCLREHSAAARLERAHERDATAEARDLAGLARDQAAAARDLAMALRDAGDEHGVGAGIVMRADEHARATHYRERAAQYRALGARAREVAAADREQGACDRLHALEDREALADALVLSETDVLTGARTRAAGLTARRRRRRSRG